MRSQDSWNLGTYPTPMDGTRVGGNRIHNGNKPKAPKWDLRMEDPILRKTSKRQPIPFDSEGELENHEYASQDLSLWTIEEREETRSKHILMKIGISKNGLHMENEIQSEF